MTMIHAYLNNANFPFLLYPIAYPNEDLASKSVVKIISKIRSSATEKLKALALMSYLKKYYVLTESERINIHG